MTEQNAYVYKFNSVDYSIEEYRDANGVVTYLCVNDRKKRPVNIRTNGKTIFHYKIGNNDDEWECCTSRHKLVQELTNSASERDESKNINGKKRNWNSSASALLYYMNWL